MVGTKALKLGHPSTLPPARKPIGEKKTGPERQATVSIGAGPDTFDCGDETVGVDEADDQRADLHLQKK